MPLTLKLGRSSKAGRKPSVPMRVAKQQASPAPPSVNAQLPPMP
jgi:hypothetical protein